MHDLSLCRSLLFLPASNPRAVAKARESGADMILLDLEDAVKEEDKPAAREGAAEATRNGFGGRPAAIRMNAVGSRHYSADVACIRDSAAPFAVLAKADSADEVKRAADAVGKPVLAMIETPAAVIAAVEIAGASTGLVAGTNDLSAMLRLPPGLSRDGLSLSLQQIVLAARFHGVAAFDGVFNGLEDAEGLADQCRQGRALGFDGKTLIHPNQIDTCNRIFGPDPGEVTAAERLIAAATGGAERHEGRMIEAMHVDQARRVLARAGR